MAKVTVTRCAGGDHIRKTIRDGGATTPSQIKAAIEAAIYADTSRDSAERDV